MSKLRGILTHIFSMLYKSIPIRVDCGFIMPIFSEKAQTKKANLSSGTGAYISENLTA